MQPYCPGQNCPLKDSCSRYKSKINVQTEIHFPYAPYNKVKNKCGFYIGSSEKGILNQLKHILNKKDV